SDGPSDLEPDLENIRRAVRDVQIGHGAPTDAHPVIRLRPFVKNLEAGERRFPRLRFDELAVSETGVADEARVQHRTELPSVEVSVASGGVEVKAAGEDFGKTTVRIFARTFRILPSAAEIEDPVVLEVHRTEPFQAELDAIPIAFRWTNRGDGSPSQIRS